MRTLFLLLTLANVLFADPCSKCGEEMENKWKYCPMCGAATTVGVDPEAKAREKRRELIGAFQELMSSYEKSGRPESAERLEALLWSLADADLEDGLAPPNELELGFFGSYGGGGGRYGGRLGGRRNLVARGGGSQGPDGTEAAVTAGLRWLARHQAPDGSWTCAGFDGKCAADAKCAGAGGKDYDVGCTGLALLAFLGSGYTHLTNEIYEDPVTGYSMSWGTGIRQALGWLIRNQDKDGCFGGGRGPKSMYNHVIATMAMGEAFGLTGNVLLRDPAQRGIDFLLAVQNPYKAWRYSPKCGDNDTSVTAWCVLAMKAAATAGLTVGNTGFEGANIWLKEVTDERDSKAGYFAMGTRGEASADRKGEWVPHESMTAAATTCRILMDRSRSGPAIEGGLKLLEADLPSSATGKVDYFYWYYGTLALFQAESPDGASWKNWNSAMKDAILPLQKTKAAGCAAGSWDPAVDPWGWEGGRIYATALNVLTLEIYYRFPVIVSRRK